VAENLQYRDEVGELIADYVVNVSDKLEARAERAAKAALIDSIAVAIVALRHPAAQNARKHAYRFPANSKGCVIWGTQKRAAPELAALTNGVLLRCHDYNDFFVGRRNSGHSSDILSGVIAVAEWTNAPGKKLLSAVALGYEMVGAAFDAFSTAPGGWDYTNLMALGATAAIARLLNLNADQAREALGMTVIPHFASDEIESGELNRRGDLSMWKRFNAADAVSNSLQACLLAQVGVEAAVRPFVGKYGFVQKMNMKDDPVPVLRERLNPRIPLSRVGEAFMKRWPVGSVAQSAIQAALDARSRVKDLSRIKQIRVFAEEGAYDHLVKIRQDPWHPISRGTADHSPRDRRPFAALYRRGRGPGRHHRGGELHSEGGSQPAAAGVHQEGHLRARAGAGLARHGQAQARGDGLFVAHRDRARRRRGRARRGAAVPRAPQESLYRRGPQ